jgi:hypothetical protein
MMNTLSNLLPYQSIGAGKVFSAPLGDLKRGHLEIASGNSNGDLRGDSAIQELFQSQFIGQIPHVRTRNESVIIRYPHSLREWFKHLILANRHAASILLNTSIPWSIDIHGGAAHLDADLQALQLSSLVIAGGVAETNLLLPRPTGTVQIYIGSGVSNLRILRPKDVSAQLKITGGVSNLIFDDQYYASIGGGIHVNAPDYQAENDRYDITVSGGVSNLSIRAQA